MTPLQRLSGQHIAAKANGGLAVTLFWFRLIVASISFLVLVAFAVTEIIHAYQGDPTRYELPTIVVVIAVIGVVPITISREVAGNVLARFLPSKTKE